MQFMPDTQTTVNTRGNAPQLDEVVTVNIDGAPAQITHKFYLAGNIADVFKVNTSAIVDFDEKHVIEKVVFGPLGIKGVWNVFMVMMGFAPKLYKEPQSLKRALLKTSIADYPSRKEVQKRSYNGAMMTAVYMDTADIYQLFLNFNVPGVRKEAARLLQGGNMGDAGVINEALQAAYDPSAGQAALQAGEPVVTVNIGGAPAQITQKFYLAGNIADVFKVNTSVIVDFDENHVIEKVVDGPQGIKGVWNVCMVLMAFAPTLYSKFGNAQRALARTSIAEYPSRKEFEIKNINERLVTVVYMNTNDIYQLFINFNVPGVRKDAGRLALAVNMGDAGVINEALQAAYDPSAGQAALQAGEPVQQPCLAFDEQALVSAMTTSISNTITSAMTVVLNTTLQTNTAAFGATMNAVLQSNNAVMTALVTKMEDRLNDVGASAAAKLAENKAETDAKLAENKAETDAKMAEIMKSLDEVAKGSALVASLDKVAKGSAPVASLRKPVRTYTKYTAEAKTKTLQWLLEHSKNPYPTPLEIEILRQETGIDTYKRMSTLVIQIRTKGMVRGENGQWHKRVEPNNASKLGNKRAWTQQNISDLM